MNTIILTEKDADGVERSVQYTETDILRFKADAAEYRVALGRIRDVRDRVHSFFAEGEWSNREQTVGKDEVNDLLEAIGATRLQSQFSGEITITATFSGYVADDEEAVRDWIGDNLELNLVNVDGDISIDDVSVFSVNEEDEY